MRKFVFYNAARVAHNAGHEGYVAASVGCNAAHVAHNAGPAGYNAALWVIMQPIGYEFGISHARAW